MRRVVKTVTVSSEWWEASVFSFVEFFAGLGGTERVLKVLVNINSAHPILNQISRNSRQASTKKVWRSQDRVFRYIDPSKSFNGRWTIPHPMLKQKPPPTVIEIVGRCRNHTITSRKAQNAH